MYELRVQSRYLIATFSIFKIVTLRTLQLAVNVVTVSAEETGRKGLEEAVPITGTRQS